MKIPRVFTSSARDPFHGLSFESRTSEIRDPNGKVIFRRENVVVPSGWSQIATDILAQKYLRKTGVPQPDGSTAGETDARQVIHRLAHTWTDWGKRYGYFSSEEDAGGFYDEIQYMLARQMAAPNSPQWFNTGLYAVYGIKGPPQGHFYVDPATNEVKESTSAYERPQPHACFILKVTDDLVNDSGIMDLVTREARLFKYGSGTGTNYSAIRGKGEPLSGGGFSSGLLSFIKVGDRSASAVKSGGTTRRAARMVTLDADHPDIEEYVDWKVREEQKVAAMVTGSRIMRKHAKRIVEATRAHGLREAADRFDPAKNSALHNAIVAALRDEVPRPFVFQVMQLVMQGHESVDVDELDLGWEGDAYATVSGQTSNNSVRLDAAFMNAVLEDGEWPIVYRVSGEEKKTIRARELWERIAVAAWKCADPGVQFHSTINEWHTCLADGEIRASNPCSEYMFLDDTACNLASLNLLAFYDRETRIFDVEAYRHAIRLWTLVLEISVLMAQFPSPSIARNSFDYRTLGLGYANLGTLLMVMGVPYDSDRGRGIAGALAAILTGEGYAASAEMAREIGQFSRYSANREHMLRVVRNHRRAAYNAASSEYEALSVTPEGLEESSCPPELLRAARAAWDRALELGEEHGYRNAQLSAIAPTGTIGLIMDCDTTGIEPDFALVKFKKLAGGGYFKIINASVPAALEALGYAREEVTGIIRYCMGHGTLQGAPGIDPRKLAEKGFTEAALKNVEEAARNAFSIRDAFSPYVVGREFLAQTLGLSEEKISARSFDLLKHLGFTEEEIEAADRYVTGTMTTEGAPHLKEAHYPVFDTASKAGRIGTRCISWRAHIGIMGSVQPFVSGAISKTINMPNNAHIEDIKGAYMMSWRRAVKSMALYRDGSKLSQPLSSLAGNAEPEYASLLELLKNGGAGEEEPAIQAEAHAARRHLLPNKRRGYTQKVKIGAHSLFLRTGEYPDGGLGEVFIDMYKEGAAFRSLLNAFARSVSIGLQYGVPLDKYVDAFIFSRFEPNGMVQGHDRIKVTTSVIDYIFRDLAVNYLDRTDLAQINPTDLLATTTTSETGHEEVEEAEGNGSIAGATRPVTGNGRHGKGRNGHADPVLVARLKGYEGDPCPVCGNFTLLRNGTCLKCETCGSTTGCS